MAQGAAAAKVGTAAMAGATLVLMTLVSSAQFLITLDASVMNVAIATVAKDVPTSTATGVQIGDHALRARSGCADDHGRAGSAGSSGARRRSRSSCVIYGAGSMTTALAKSLTVLIFGWSLLEGIGAALILPAVVALVAANFPAEARPKAYGLVMSAGAIAVAVGPLIGGLFTTYLSWRLVFAFEVVIVIAILVLARKIEDEPVLKRPKLDVVGVVLSASGLAIAVFGVLKSGTWGWITPRSGAPELWGVSLTLWLIFGGVFVVWLFLRWERRLTSEGKETLVKLSMFEVPAADGRTEDVLLPVLHPVGNLLRRPTLPLGVARTVGDPDGGAAAAAVADAPARRGGNPAVLP